MLSRARDFRAELLVRLARAAKVTSAALLATTGAACGARSDLFNTAAGGAGDSSPSGGSGGAGGTLGGAGSSGSGGVGGALINIDGGGPGGSGGLNLDSGTWRDTRCVDRILTDAGTDATEDAGGGALGCPSADDLLRPPMDCPECGSVTHVLAVNSGPVVSGSSCCYDVTVGQFFCGCYVGRAFLVDEGFLKAGSRRGRNWRTGPAPDVSGLSDATRRALAEAWEKDGLFEHASVATFSRFAMQLLALGAPAALLRQTLAAGIDEIKHAELCFALASAYAGEDREPDVFPIGTSISLETDLDRMLVETVVEGCIGETLAAVQAAESLAHARDAAVVAALRETVEDETRHAELAWRVTAWAISVGGERTRKHVSQVFAGFRPPARPREDLAHVDLVDFAAHGRLTADEARATALSALSDVVEPCARAMTRA